MEDRRIPKTTANSELIRPAGRGREAVLAISASSFFSIHWFKAAAPPAAKAVPKVREKKIDKSACRGSLTKYPRDAVKTDNKLSLGLVNSYIPCNEIPGVLDSEPGWGLAGMGFPRLTSEEFLIIELCLGKQMQAR